MNRIVTGALGAMLLSILAACSKPAPAPEAAGPPELPAEARSIENYVNGIEAEFRSKYTQKEILLTPELLQGVSQMPWLKMHVYLDAGEIKRIKLYPPEGEAKIEEFYYRGGQLAYVSVEPAGVDANREQLFFAAGQLLGVIGTDGAVMSLGGAQLAYGEKMLREGMALLRIAQQQ